MKTVPVLLSFDQQQVIGSLTIDETRLPPGDGYVFSLGYQALKSDGEIDLLCVSLQADEQYVAYLEHRKRIPKFGISPDSRPSEPR